MIDYRQAVSNLKLQKDDNAEDTSLGFALLSVSFDLVNSTAFKAQVQNWHVVIHYFYDLVFKEMQNSCYNIRVWKYVGDEVLFYKPIEDIDALAIDIGRIYHICRSVSTSVQNSFEPARKFLSVKATAWVARAVKIPPQDIEELRRKWLNDNLTLDNNTLTNILVNVSVNESEQSVDFLGPDVDAGFRIARYSHNEKLTISADLAYLLANHARFSDIKRDDMRIVVYEQLKGIWGERFYPIIWYHENWKDIDSSFAYDEEYRSPLIRNIKGKKIKPNIENLKTIFRDLGREEYVNLILKAMGPDRLKSQEKIPMIPRGRLAELHCVAICISSDNKILIAKRLSSKPVLPDVWEFGCAQLREGEDFSDAIISGYKEDFAAQIVRVSHIPIATYLIDRPRKVPGLIFVAQVNNKNDIEASYSREKHSEIRWISRNEAQKFTNLSAVPDFYKNISAAMEYISREWIEPL